MKIKETKVEVDTKKNKKITFIKHSIVITKKIYVISTALKFERKNINKNHSLVKDAI